MSTNFLNTSVNELMFDFLEGLNALVPTLKRTKILNEDLYGYEGWDVISEGLFRALVEDSILWSLNDKEMKNFKLLKYGFVDCDTKSESYILATFKSNPSGVFIFGGFTTSDGNLFDQVVIQDISDSKFGEITKCNVSDINFSCAFYNGNNHKIINEVTVYN